MAKRVQRYRVTSTVMATLIGRVGELIVNLTGNSLHVHDAVTPGGFELARADMENVQNATASQFGRMTPAQVTELTNATAALVLKLDEISATTNRAVKWASSGAAVADSDVSLAGTYTAGAFVDAFPSGSTGRLLAWSSAAPPGYTQNTALGDYAFRLTSGSGGGTGGTVAFETGLKNQTMPDTFVSAAVTLTANQSGLRSHLHTIAIESTNVMAGGGNHVIRLGGSINTANVAAAAAISSHTHALTGGVTAVNLDIRYLNTIRIEKD